MLIVSKQQEEEKVATAVVTVLEMGWIGSVKERPVGGQVLQRLETGLVLSAWWGFLVVRLWEVPIVGLHRHHATIHQRQQQHHRCHHPTIYRQGLLV